MTQLIRQSLNVAGFQTQNSTPRKVILCIFTDTLSLSFPSVDSRAELKFKFPALPHTNCVTADKLFNLVDSSFFEM